jgi:pimeloyl-ACP methyl ester carboxylesterase
VGGAVALLYALDNPERIRGSTYHLINGAGHFMMLEKPLEFNEILSGFLKNIAT